MSPFCWQPSGEILLMYVRSTYLTLFGRIAMGKSDNSDVCIFIFAVACDLPAALGELRAAIRLCHRGCNKIVPHAPCKPISSRLLRCTFHFRDGSSTAVISAPALGLLQSPAEKTNDISWIFCTGSFLVFRCNSEISILGLLTESMVASAVGAQKKISFTPIPIRITATAAMIT